MELEELQYSGVTLELKVHFAKYKSSSDTLNKMMSARKKVQLMNTVFPRLSAYALMSALPRINAYPLFHNVKKAPPPPLLE